MKIFENIIKYLKKIFSSQKNLNSGEKEQENLINEKNIFKDSLQRKSKENLNKKRILDEINKNPNLINTLSYSRLVQLNNLYEERISELERKINQIS